MKAGKKPLKQAKLSPENDLVFITLLTNQTTGAPSVQISIRYADNIVTLYRLRRPSRRPVDYT